MERQQDSDTTQVGDRESLGREMSSARLGLGTSSLVPGLIFFYYALLFCRPQHIPGLGFLGQARLPAAVSILIGLILLPQLVRSKWMPQIKIIFAFLCFEVVRGFVGYFFDPADRIVRNDAWQFHTWRDLGMQFIGLVAPVALFLSSVKRLRQVFFVSVLVGVYLGLWGLTHNGMGPGGFVEDENDLCFVLVMLLPFAIFFFRSSHSGMSKLFGMLSTLIILGGAFSTLSRGGFLGLLAVLGYQLIVTRRKHLFLLAGSLLFVASLPFLPQTYWQEMGTIKTDMGRDKGTMRERLDTWAICLRIWSDPSNIVFGVGLQNTPFYIADYQPLEHRVGRRSLAGRAAHSMYFQLLPDLGLVGLGFIGGLIFVCFRGNRRWSKLLDIRLKHLSGLNRNLTQIAGHLSSGQGIGAGTGAFKSEELLEEVMQRQRIVDLTEKDAQFLRQALPTVSVAFVGILVAGLGVSVLYYPPLWLLAGMSAALEGYLRKTEPIFSGIISEGLNYAAQLRLTMPGLDSAAKDSQDGDQEEVDR